MPGRRIVFGIGVGIIFTSLAFYFLYSWKLADFDKTLEAAVLDVQGDNYGYDGAKTLSDEDIIARAEALGMAFVTATPTDTPLITPTIDPLPPTVVEASPSPETSDRPTPPPTPDVTPAQTPVIPTETPATDGLPIEPLQTLEPRQTSEIEPLNSRTPVTSTSPDLDYAPEPAEDETAEPLPTVRETPSHSYDESRGTVTVRIPDGLNATEVSKLLENAGIVESAQDFLQVLRDKEYTMIIASGTFTLTTDMDYDAIAEAIIRKKR